MYRKNISEKMAKKLIKNEKKKWSKKKGKKNEDLKKR